MECICTCTAHCSSLNPTVSMSRHQWPLVCALLFCTYRVCGEGEVKFPESSEVKPHCLLAFLKGQQEKDIEHLNVLCRTRKTSSCLQNFLPKQSAHIPGFLNFLVSSLKKFANLFYQLLQSKISLNMDDTLLRDLNFNLILLYANMFFPCNFDILGSYLSFFGTSALLQYVIIYSVLIQAENAANVLNPILQLWKLRLGCLSALPKMPQEVSREGQENPGLVSPEAALLACPHRTALSLCLS